MMERMVRPMFMKIVEWYIGIKTGFSASVGKSGKFMKTYLPESLYDKILTTYSDHHLENNWQALFTMVELFGQLAPAIASDLKFHYELSEEKNVTNYLKKVYQEQI
jgi:aminoglycoside 6-adenylyltransferase